MLITILCTFRQAHYEFLVEHMNKIIKGGPLLGLDGTAVAMLMVVERATLEEAQDFIAHEPYTKAGLFESVLVRQWKHVIPEPVEGYVQLELAKEKSASAS